MRLDPVLLDGDKCQPNGHPPGDGHDEEGDAEASRLREEREVKRRRAAHKDTSDVSKTGPAMDEPMRVAESRPELKRASEQCDGATGKVEEQPKAIRPEPPEVGLAIVEREVLDRGSVVLETFVRQETERQSDNGLPHAGILPRTRDHQGCTSGYIRVHRRTKGRKVFRDPARGTWLAVIVSLMFSTRRIAVACLAAALLPAAVAAQSNTPCEEYSRSAAVFVGTAGAPVTRVVQLPYHPPLQMTLTPIEVDRAYLGVTTRTVYITTLSAQTYATAGERYLIYGRAYHPPDIVMARPGAGMKEIGTAADDLAFLESLAPGSAGSTIFGEVAQKEIVYGGTSNASVPLAGVPVRIANATHATEASTDRKGRFTASGVPPGRYQIVPRLPAGLIVIDPTTRTEVVVRDGGCAHVKIEAVFNGRVTGILRGPDGRPLQSTFVDLMPMDVAAEPRTGQVTGTNSVSTNDKGEFEFTGRAPGRYYLGVSLYNAPNLSGPSYPRTYYPGTLDRTAAVPVIIEQGRTRESFDFSIPLVLSKGEFEYIVETQHAGRLKFCFIQLDDLFKRWSSHAVKPGVTYRGAVVDGQRYEVHVHLELPDGHLESEPFVFTATSSKTSVTLRPDAPRDLHR